MPQYSIQYTVNVMGVRTVQADSAESACKQVKHAAIEDLLLDSMECEEACVIEVEPNEGFNPVLQQYDGEEEEPEPAKPRKRGKLRLVPKDAELSLEELLS